MAVVAFTGVNTGNVYRVGQTYQLATGEKKVAQADGSFRSLSTGRVTPGSSRSSTATFFHSGPATSSRSGSGSGSSGGTSRRVTDRTVVQAGVSVGLGGGVSLSPAPGGSIRSFGSGAGAGNFTVRLSADPTNPAVQAEDVPLERTGAGDPFESYDAISDVGWARTNTGLVVVPSKDVKERIEDDIFQQAGWLVRNRILPDLALVPQPQPPNIEVGSDPGQWQYSFWSSEWQQNGPGRTYVDSPLTTMPTERQITEDTRPHISASGAIRY